MSNNSSKISISSEDILNSNVDNNLTVRKRHSPNLGILQKKINLTLNIAKHIF